MQRQLPNRISCCCVWERSCGWWQQPCPQHPVCPQAILRDDMGINKTLETLMLVMASQLPKGRAVADLSKVQRRACGPAPKPCF